MSVPQIKEALRLSEIALRLAAETEAVYHFHPGREVEAEACRVCKAIEAARSAIKKAQPHPERTK